VIPISITLDIQATGEAPSPYYLMASRLSYFPIVCAEVIDYFRNLFPDLPLDSEFWLAAPGLSSTSFSSASSSSTSTSNEVPLKWQYPIGVLFDMYGNPQSYPWKLILRFKDFPEQLLRCEKGVETVRWHYMQVLKEASYLKFRTKAQVHRMPLKQQRNLWQAVSTIPPHYDLFHQTIQPLAGDTIISLAIRVLQPTKSNSFKQSPVIPLNADGSEKTLKAVLQEILQTEFSPASQRVVIQGISAPLDSSIVWLSKICMHPEHFLWIVVV
ncbi:MAG: autophagy protein 5, partial [Microbacteriaceae bacterium]|nr:autophagy protein 5 [Microbacteriaceae bacterium]